jgi:hypothetical protein
MANKHRKVWKVVSQKVLSGLSGKQRWSYYKCIIHIGSIYLKFKKKKTR